MSKQFEEFLITDIFEIKNGVRLKSDDHIPGSTPYISSRKGNNGISGWVSNSNSSLDSGVLGVNYNGNVLEAYYHPYEALFSDDVKRFKIKDEKPNCRKYMYLATAIKKLKKAYSYTKKFNSSEISKSTITLPVTDESAGTDSPEPDWEYMEEYIKGIEAKYLDDVVKYNKRNGEILDALHPDYHGSAPEAHDYAEFRVGDVFEIGSGANIPQANMSEAGTYPVIAGVTENNGIRGYVNTAKDTLKNALTITCRGRSGVTFWHPYEFVLGNNALSIQRKKDVFTSQQALYVGTALSKLGYGGSYSEYVTYTSLSKDEITLPVTPTGEPDWDYMENYIRRIEKQEREKIARYVQHKKSVSSGS